MKFFQFVIFAIVFIVSGWQIFAACPVIQPTVAITNKTKTDNTKQPRFALLIGVADYKNETIPDLTGAGNDVALMRETLVSNFGFLDDAKHMKTLCDAESTRDAIISLFRTHLIANAKKAKEAGKDAIIVFHFTGHGDRYPNQEFEKEDELGDGWDETILPYDTRTTKISVDKKTENVHDILDDELDDLFAELSQYTSNAVFILDSCHSGSATRGTDFVAKETGTVDTAERTPYKRKFPMTGSKEAAERSEKYLTISAAQANQRAYMRPKQYAENSPGSELTYHLTAAMRRATATTTWRDVIWETAAAIKNEVPIQDANAEGGKLGAYIFDGSATRVDNSIQILPNQIRSTNTITLAVGRRHGVLIGSQVAIYDETATKFKGKDKFLLNAVIKEVSDNRSIAQLPTEQQNPNVKKITQNSRVILSMPNLGGTGVALVLEPNAKTGADAPMIATIRNIMKDNLLIDNGLLELADSVAAVKKATIKRTSPILTLKRAPFEIAFPDPNLAMRPATCMTDKSWLPDGKTEVYYLDDGTGIPLYGNFFSVTNERSADDIVMFVNNFAQYRTVQNIENKDINSLSYAVEIGLEFKPQTTAFSCVGIDEYPRTNVTECATKPALALKNELPLGAIYQVRVKNIWRDDVYITVLHLTNDGGIKKIYPLGEGSTLLAAGREIVTDGDKGIFVTAQPTGSEMIKVLITDSPADFDFLQAPAVKGQRKGGRIFDTLLTNSGAKLTRGENLPSDKPESWGVRTLRYIITPQQATCAAKK